MGMQDADSSLSGFTRFGAAIVHRLFVQNESLLAMPTSVRPCLTHSRKRNWATEDGATSTLRPKPQQFFGCFTPQDFRNQVVMTRARRQGNGAVIGVCAQRSQFARNHRFDNR
ncbi:hypothetical protein Pla52n_10870 [Stieleria varia]|uniref:Uncharacterized protein n=1 Tax=Stieleria varia TaxID=2528005 RepID=A0A5C6BDH6_9BACT|nr:hypothetical protein Pla52n_10870 [Stieleria varia]